MKKNIIHLLSMLTIVALLTPLATACSSDELDPPFSLSTPKGASKVHVSVGAGISGDATRSAVDYTSGVRTLQFTAGDKLYVYAPTTNDGSFDSFIAGYLTVKDGSISADGTSAKFEGDLDYYEWNWNIDVFHYQKATPHFTTADPLAECITANVEAQLVHAGTESYYSYETQSSNPQYRSNGHYNYNGVTLPTTVEDFMTKRLLVKANGYDATNHCFDLAVETYGGHNAIFNCTISGLPASKNYNVSISRGSGTYSGYLTQTDASGIAHFVFNHTDAYTTADTYTIRLTNTADNTDTYSFDIGPLTLQNKVYNITRTWTGVSFAKKLVDLSTLTGDYTAQDDETLTGTLTGNYKISIASGATVTLKDVVITNLGNNCNWAAINCENDATLIVKGTNTVRAGKNENGFILFPGIWIASGKTLTIQGDGSLTVNDYGNIPFFFSAGIGGGLSLPCGNIVIEGGTITAIGGEHAAGIGGGSSTFGNITIKGGTVIATCGENGGAGIGCGCGSHLTSGDIIIEGGNITATGGEGAGIGCARQQNCGDITISGGTIKASGGSKAAGIGSCGGSQCGNINITGGTITATSGVYGAGIGSGDAGECGNISISGTMTKVTATGGNYAPGIGIGTADGGEYEELSDSDSGFMPTPSCGTITITGGTITATGGTKSAAIGAGRNFYANDITITNTVTKVTATKGSNANYSIATVDSHDLEYHTLTIGGIVTGNISDSPYIYQP